jgi:hypothetical protein
MRHSLGARMITVLGPIRIINLAERRDRRAEVTGELARIGLSPRMPGVMFHTRRAPGGQGRISNAGHARLF